MPHPMGAVHNNNNNTPATTMSKSCLLLYLVTYQVDKERLSSGIVANAKLMLQQKYTKRMFFFKFSATLSGVCLCLRRHQTKNRNGRARSHSQEESWLQWLGHRMDTKTVDPNCRRRKCGRTRVTDRRHTSTINDMGRPWRSHREADVVA